MLLRERAAAALLAITALAASGCVNGQSRDIPPGPTAVPPGASVFVYVAQARQPGLGTDGATDGGAVVVYQLGSDGFLPGQPKASVQAVNPRRLVRHPEKPILYVATASQVLAFDMTGGELTSLCGPNGGAAAPCATAPAPGSNPVDMKFARNSEGNYLLYVVERGGGNNLDTLTRMVAYELDENGGLPSQPSSQVQTNNSLSFQGAEVVIIDQNADPPGYAYVADAGQSNITRFPLLADGNLPNPVPTGTPLTPTPTPEPDPTPSPDPSPSPTAWRASNPARMIRAVVATPAPPAVEPTPTGLPLGEVLYVVEQGRRRIGAIPIDQEGNLPKNPTSESNTRGIYNSIIVDSSVSPTRIYGAALQNGQVDSFQIDGDGNIIDGSLSATFANTASYPTGVALLPPTGASTTSTLFVSLGGFNRVDAYAVNPDGTLPELPFSSTDTVNDTFPSDVLVYTE
jgi:6-phosphogluconolactonase (cycloisomerase 2 family)